MPIYVDADACPVKEETVRVAERFEVSVFIVSNGGIRPSKHPLVESIYVADGPDVADDWIAERAGPGDVAITSDIPLADRCIKAGAVVIKPNGTVLDASNIGQIVATRNLLTNLRNEGTIQSRSAEFTNRDRSRFLETLDRVLRARGSGQRG